MKFFGLRDPTFDIRYSVVLFQLSSILFSLFLDKSGSHYDAE
jgi:hypothetical protein